MMCRRAAIPVMCCCETYKFSDRIMLDSIVGNELGKRMDSDVKCT
jgi:translation initiation factor eIF-2B subunit delta